ncbi:MAG TPA: hypothetical protein PKZ84_16540 [Anaerolineae bacterium]|nr:hypothetical protein [Anaerolineae bacterium]HQI86232.1 hypothetical protein [Anaerolineae bacterium]
MTPRTKPWLIWTGSLLALLYLLAFTLNITPYLRGPAAWRWAYAIPGHPWRHLLPLAVVAAYLALALFWSRKFPPSPTPSLPHSPTRFLLFIALAVPLIQAALLFPESPDILRPLFYRTISPGASGVFTVGSTIADPAEFLRRYPELMPTFPVHPQRYPPGLPLLFYGARRVLEAAPSITEPLGMALRLYQCQDFALMRLSNTTIATALLQMALPILAGLIVFPLYGLARRTAGEQAALWAVITYPLVPSFALWSARWDQFYPLLTCAAWYCFWRGLTNQESRIKNQESRIKNQESANRRISESRFTFYVLRFTFYVSRFALHRAWFFLGGVLLAFASFLSFGPLTMLAPLGLNALLWILPHPERRRWLPLAGDALVFFAGLVAPWLVYHIAFGNGFLDIWRVSMSYHLGLGRDYWTWVFFHLYDFFAFLGAPMAIGFTLGVGYAIRDVWRKQDAGVLPLGFALGLLLLDLSGAAQGEVARVWLFLTPFAVITAAYGLARLTDKHWHRALLAALLALHVLVFNAFLRVVTTGVTDPPMRTHTFSLDARAHPVNAELGDAILLLGYAVEPERIEPGITLHLTLYWQARRQMTQPYTVFTHLLGPDGDLAAQQDNMPQSGNAPTTCWIPGEIIADDYALAVPADAAPGAYTLTTGLYLWETGDRLPTRGTGATPDNEIVLTTFTLPGAP